MLTRDPESMREIAPENRVLLLPQCLRPSKQCNAHYDRDEGLLCESCTEACPINQLKTAAEKRNFGGVCIAPGGSLAIRYVEAHQPQGIVAVACHMELELGIQAVTSLSNNGNNPPNTVVLLTIPLRRDGCVDTGVDLETVTKTINL